MQYEIYTIKEDVNMVESQWTYECITITILILKVFMTRKIFAIVFLLVSSSTQAMDLNRRSPKHEDETPVEQAKRAAKSNNRNRSQSLTAEKTALPDDSNNEVGYTSGEDNPDVFSSENQEVTSVKIPVAAVLAKKSTSHSKLRVFSPVPLTSQPRKSIELVSLRKIMNTKK